MTAPSIAVATVAALLVYSFGRAIRSPLRRWQRRRKQGDCRHRQRREPSSLKSCSASSAKNGWTWKHICAEIGGMSPVLVTGAILGQMKLTKPQAAKAAELFGLSKTEQALLNEVPHRGSPMPPTDPLIYRFYELVMINGPALKVLIEEEFGDGIMSAIDFDLAIERQPDPKGDRVRISMSGKFLPYKYYGATGNVPTYGYKEE